MPKLPPDPAQSPIPTTGLGSVFWACPRCKSPYWGTSGEWRHCNGSAYGYGPCHFRSMVENDWMYFRRASDCSHFTSRDEYQEHIAPSSAVLS